MSTLATLFAADSGAAASKHRSSGEELLHKRYLFALMSMVGQTVRVTLRNAAVYEGIFHAASVTPLKQPGLGVVLKMARQVRAAESGAQEVIPGQDMIVPASEFVEMVAVEAEFSDSNDVRERFNSLATDASIAGRARPELVGRELQRASDWLTDAPISSLEDVAGRPGKWDQFEANNRLFGVKGEFVESHYTTELDNREFTREQQERASRIAAEIMSQPAQNPHVAMDRGQALEEEYDEETLYSGVLETSAPAPVSNSGTTPARYLPPHRRSGPATTAPAAASNAPAAAATAVPAATPAGPASGNKRGPRDNQSGDVRNQATRSGNASPVKTAPSATPAPAAAPAAAQAPATPAPAATPVAAATPIATPAAAPAATPAAAPVAAAAARTPAPAPAAAAPAAAAASPAPASGASTPSTLTPLKSKLSAAAAEFVPKFGGAAAAVAATAPVPAPVAPPVPVPAPTAHMPHMGPPMGMPAYPMYAYPGYPGGVVMYAPGYPYPYAAMPRGYPPQQGMPQQPPHQPPGN